MSGRCTGLAVVFSCLPVSATPAVREARKGPTAAHGDDASGPDLHQRMDSYLQKKSKGEAVRSVGAAFGGAILAEAHGGDLADEVEQARRL
jgi:hypothetical protein